MHNPHPKLAIATWGLICAAVAAGVLGYWHFWFNNIYIETGRAVAERFEILNGVKIPLEISGLKLQRASVSVGRPRYLDSGGVPEEGTIEGVVYGGPGDRFSFHLFSMAADGGSGKDDPVDYLGRIIADGGAPSSIVRRIQDVRFSGYEAWIAKGEVKKREAESPENGNIAKSETNGRDAPSGIAVCASAEGRLWVLFTYAANEEEESAGNAITNALAELVLEGDEIE